MKKQKTTCRKRQNKRSKTQRKRKIKVLRSQTEGLLGRGSGSGSGSGVGGAAAAATAQDPDEDKRELSQFLEENGTGELFGNYANIERIKIRTLIPKSIRLMRSLDMCRIQGEVTEESLQNLAPLINLKVIYFDGTSNIPESLFSLTQLTSVRFSLASIDSPLSPQIGRLTNLHALTIFDSFTGSVFLTLF